LIFIDLSKVSIFFGKTPTLISLIKEKGKEVGCSSIFVSPMQSMYKILESSGFTQQGMNTYLWCYTYGDCQELREEYRKLDEEYRKFKLNKSTCSFSEKSLELEEFIKLTDEKALKLVERFNSKRWTLEEASEYMRDQKI
jgi:hypothetical protein